jgi:hypothetical protein
MSLPGKLCLFALAIIWLAGCGSREAPTQPTISGTSAILSTAEDAFTKERLDLVREHIKGAGITNEDVLRAMSTVPRHKFVPPDYLDQAYEDHPLPIGHGQPNM